MWYDPCIFNCFFFSLLRRDPVDKFGLRILYPGTDLGKRASILSVHPLTCCSHAKCKLNINQYYDSGTPANLRGIPIYWPALNSYLFFFKPMLGLVTGSMISWISSRAASSSFWVGLEVLTRRYAPPQDFRSSLYSSGISSTLPSCQSCRHLHSTRISANISPSKLGSCRWTQIPVVQFWQGISSCWSGARRWSKPWGGRVSTMGWELKNRTRGWITLRSVKRYTDIRSVAGVLVPHAGEFYDVYLQGSSNGEKLFLMKQVHAICVLIEGRFVQVRAMMRYQWKWVTFRKLEEYCEKIDHRIDKHEKYTVLNKSLRNCQMTHWQCVAWTWSLTMNLCIERDTVSDRILGISSMVRSSINIGIESQVWAQTWTIVRGDY